MCLSSDPVICLVNAESSNSVKMDFISLRVTFCQIYSLLETFPGFTGSDRWLTAMSAVVKMCIIVLVFPHCCLPRFHLEEMFPFAAWKQAAGQQQVSLFLVVRSLKPPLYYYYYHETINPYAQIMVYHHMFKEIMGALQFILSFSVCLACHFTPLPVPFLFF